MKKGTSVALAAERTGPTYSFILNGTTINTADYPVLTAISFAVNASPWTPSSEDFLPSFFTYSENVAATYSQMLYQANNGVLANETYKAYSNQVCDGGDAVRNYEACYSPGSKFVYLGPQYAGANTQTLSTTQHTTLSKFVIAHEIGHQFQARSTGSYYYNYNRAALVPQPALLCRCDGLNPNGNEIHCLQSTEQQGAAQVEGFAQFTASNTWNDPTSSNCNFAYYKGFRTSSQTFGPPYAVSCNTAVKWGETNCPMDDRATEYDWMGYYTSIARAPTGPVNQTDLASVYKKVCELNGGTPGALCNPSFQMLWSPASGFGLPDASKSVFGTNTLRDVTFRTNGPKYGITR